MLASMYDAEVATASLSSGLAQTLPEDADLVVVLGPKTPLAAETVRAMSTYLDAGGSLLLALEPETDRVTPGSAPRELLERAGVRLGTGLVANMREIVPLTRTNLDRFNVLTNQFAPHPITREVASSERRLGFFSPVSTTLEPVDVADEVEREALVRVMPQAWIDANRNADFDEGEVRGKGVVAIASSAIAPNATEEAERATWRIVATSDATAFSDLAMTRSPGNLQFSQDAIGWLLREEAYSGVVDRGQDQRIAHTKEGQRAWFLGTVVLVPILVLGAGGVQALRRRRELTQEEADG